MKNILHIPLISLLLVLSSCITEFVPETEKDTNFLVVEGLITDKPEVYTIRLSRSMPLGTTKYTKPLAGCTVTVTDDLGGSFDFKDTDDGIYTSDPANFTGTVGRFYTLHIVSGSENQNLRYESYPMELKPVPPIDSLYYEKVVFQEGEGGIPSEEGCQIYLDTHDPNNECKYYRWEYAETWEFHLPYTVPNNTCWLSGISDVINIKDVSQLAEKRVKKYPINLITNTTDRLSQEYSIIVNQYSLNEDEHLYWKKLENISEQVGGLYDIIPSAIAGNMYCVDNPYENVFGYFSVSSHSSKRIFIKDNFAGVYNPYSEKNCISDTIYGNVNDPYYNLNISVWVLITHTLPPPSYRVITNSKQCYDCTLRGTSIRPDFWKEDK
jgi:hypothetical protein